jgi:hypothetical protein
MGPQKAENKPFSSAGTGMGKSMHPVIGAGNCLAVKQQNNGDVRKTLKKPPPTWEFR